MYQFVRDSLENGWQPFELVAPGGQKLKDDESALNECNLVGEDQRTLSAKFNLIIKKKKIESHICLHLPGPSSSADLHVGRGSAGRHCCRRRKDCCSA